MLKVMIYATCIILIFFFQNECVKLNILTAGAVNCVIEILVCVLLMTLTHVH